MVFVSVIFLMNLIFILNEWKVAALEGKFSKI